MPNSLIPDFPITTASVPRGRTCPEQTFSSRRMTALRQGWSSGRLNGDTRSQSAIPPLEIRTHGFVRLRQEAVELAVTVL
jgi:hypothetical protein